MTLLHVEVLKSTRPEEWPWESAEEHWFPESPLSGAHGVLKNAFVGPGMSGLRVARVPSGTRARAGSL